AASEYRVMVACKSAETDQPVARFTSQLHWPAGTQGFVIAGVQSMYAGHVPKWLEERVCSPEVEAMSQAWLAAQQAEIASKQKEMEAFKATLPPPFHANKPIVAEGHAGDQILAAVSTQHIDLLIVGAGSASTMTRWLLGSTSTTLLNHAPCSV